MRSTSRRKYNDRYHRNFFYRTYTSDQHFPYGRLSSLLFPEEQ